MNKIRKYLAIKVLDFAIWFLESGKDEGLEFTEVDALNLEKLKKVRKETFNGA